MSHTFTNLLTHVIFSTHERVPMIVDGIRADLHGLAIALTPASRAPVSPAPCSPGSRLGLPSYARFAGLARLKAGLAARLAVVPLSVLCMVDLRQGAENPLITKHRG